MYLIILTEFQMNPLAAANMNVNNIASRLFALPVCTILLEVFKNGKAN